jgi:hypothetical protein
MIRLIEFLIALAIVLALFVVVGLVLPSKRHLEESVETNRRMTIVFDTVNNVRRLKDWSLLMPSLPENLKYSDKLTGVGARVEFTSEDPRWGSGRWEIVESEMPTDGGSGKVAFSIEDTRPGRGKRSTVLLEPTGRNGRNVKVTQTYDVEYGWNLFGRFMGMYVSRHVGDSVKASLSKLSNVLATVPNFDYRAEGSKLTGLALAQLPAEDLLVVNAGNIERNNETIKASIKANQEWIKRVMDSNGLEPAGPVRIITTDFGAEKYAFDVAQPVRKRSASPAADTSDDEEGDAATANAAPSPAALPNEPLENVKVEGTPVEYVRVEPRAAASASYTGYMAELDAVRNSLRAWAMTNGYEVADRPYESWKGGVEQAFTAEGSFDVFWSIKQ